MAGLKVSSPCNDRNRCIKPIAILAAPWWWTTIAVIVNHESPPNQPLEQPPSIPPPIAQVPELSLGLQTVRVILLGIITSGIVLEHGFYGQPVEPQIIHWLQTVVLAVYGTGVWVRRYLGRFSLRNKERDWVDALLLGFAFLGAGLEELGGASEAWRLFELAAVLLLVTELWRFNVILSRRFYRPGILLPASFLTMITVGTLLLKAPRAVPAGQSISWLDAVFTMTSAVCVTGLIVRDTATQFTPYGQAVIGVFIQLGGLGIIIFGSMLAMLLGTQMSLRENISLSAMLNDQPLGKVTSFVRFIVLATLGLELVGAAVMMPMWDGPLTFGQRVGTSLFHSVSAFCNAGFSLQSDGLESYRYALPVHLVILPLVVIGGLGFPVLSNLWQTARWRWQRRRHPSRPMHFQPFAKPTLQRLNLHTKIVLTMTAGLYLYGAAGIMIGQLKPYTDTYFQQGVTANRAVTEQLSFNKLGTTLADASFMSLTARTAGFNTVPMDEVSPAGRFVLITLMMIGASPGSTGGGMKTTTAMLLLLTVVATARQRAHTEAFTRRVREELIRKAATLAACFIALATVATLLLMLSEPYPFEKIAFEAVSAASTTGLSLGITGDLTAFGKAVIIATMFLGRVGPLALLGALMFRTSVSRPYDYPHESVVLG